MNTLIRAAIGFVLLFAASGRGLAQEPVHDSQVYTRLGLMMAQDGTATTHLSDIKAILGPSGSHGMYGLTLLSFGNSSAYGGTGSMPFTIASLLAELRGSSVTGTYTNGSGGLSTTTISTSSTGLLATLATSSQRSGIADATNRTIWDLANRSDLLNATSSERTTVAGGGRTMWKQLDDIRTGIAGISFSGTFDATGIISAINAHKAVSLSHQSEAHADSLDLLTDLDLIHADGLRTKQTLASTAEHAAIIADGSTTLTIWGQLNAIRSTLQDSTVDAPTGITGPEIPASPLASFVAAAKTHIEAKGLNTWDTGFAEVEGESEEPPTISLTLPLSGIGSLVGGATIDDYDIDFTLPAMNSTIRTVCNALILSVWTLLMLPWIFEEVRRYG